MLQERQIPFYRLRGRVYFTKHRLLEWLTSFEHNPLNRKEGVEVLAGKRKGKETAAKRYIE